MEQKTEASQAVDELLPCPLCTSQSTLLIRAIACDSCLCELGRSKGQSDADLAMEWNQRAALKAQPAPTSKADPVKYEQRFISPEGASAPWHDASAETFQRYHGSGDIGEGWRHQVRALYDRPAPTEAAQDALSANPNLTTSGVTCQPVAAQGNTSNNSSSSQLSGNSGELQPSGNTGELAQGEDSARLAAGYKSSTMVSDFYGPKVTLRYETTEQADAAHDTLVSMIDRASAETGGVKP